MAPNSTPSLVSVPEIAQVVNGLEEVLSNHVPHLTEAITQQGYALIYGYELPTEQSPFVLLARLQADVNALLGQLRSPGFLVWLASASRALKREDASFAEALAYFANCPGHGDFNTSQARQEHAIEFGGALGV